MFICDVWCFFLCRDVSHKQVAAFGLHRSSAMPSPDTVQ